jgi:hypothetical protein
MVSDGVMASSYFAYEQLRVPLKVRVQKSISPSVVAEVVTDRKMRTYHSNKSIFRALFPPNEGTLTTPSPDALELIESFWVWMLSIQ